MTDLLITAANDLVKRERPYLVVASGLLFRELSDTAKQHSLEDVLVSSRGGTWGEESTPGYGHPVLRSTNMRGSYVDVADAAWRDVPPAHAEACALETGDILVIKSSGSSDLVGKAVLFVRPGDSQTYLFSNFTLRLRPNQDMVLPEFLAWFLRSPQALMWRYEAQHTTVGLRNLKTRDFLRQIVPVPALHIQEAVVAYLNALEQQDSSALSIELPPSLDEQRRIVARIEELAALIEEARGLRAAAKQDTGKLAQAALRDTFENLRDEVRETKPFSDIVSEILNGMSKRIWVDPPEGVASLNIRNITQQDSSIASCRRILFDSERHTKYLTQLGDLLICNVNGSPRLVGAIAVFPGASEQVVIDHNITRIRLKSEALPEFIVYHLREPTTRVAIEARFGTTAGQSYLPQRKLVTLPLSIPPLSEQRHIVAYLDDLQAQVDELTALQDATQAELEALLPSVLDQAFRGEL